MGRPVSGYRVRFYRMIGRPTNAQSGWQRSEVMLDVGKDGFTLGRDEKNDAIINDPAVSRRQGKVFRQGDDVFYQDGNGKASTNGSAYTPSRCQDPYKRDERLKGMISSPIQPWDEVLIPGKRKTYKLQFCPVD